MASQTEFFECVCTADEHNSIELYTPVFLNQYRGFFGRLWIAVKYLFGYKCKYGHWDCTVLRSEDIDRLMALLQKYKQLLSNKE